jgi:glycosyltransferase involved in cell wall biosynthesis
MSMIAPAVSVIIPAYKAAAYIGETLDSVYAQTFTDYEIIVINDGSPDTQDLERELKCYPSSLRYLKQENRGAAAARNTGIRAATGEFVAFLDADDIWFPKFLEYQVDFINMANVDLAYSDAQLVGDSPLAGRTFMQVQPSRGEVTPESLLSVTVTVLTSAVLARKKPILDVGLFDEGIKRGHDFDLWFRLAKAGARFAYHSTVLAEHRVVDSGLSGGTISQLERTLAVLETIHNRGGLTSAEEAAFLTNKNRTLATLALEIGKTRLLKKDFGGALESFNESRALGSSWKLVVLCLGLRIAPNLLWRVYQTRSMPVS